MSSLQIDGLVKRFGLFRALDNVSLSVEAGTLLVLLGPSGCGKTTLLRCIAGLEDAQEGKISFGEKEVFDAQSKRNLPTFKRDIGLVFQNYSLWPHMTVAGNVEYPLRARRIGASEQVKRRDEILEVVQCRHLMDRYPAMLSGGQQQRIALARALAPQPALMLLDEPLSNLDALLRVELRSQLRAIHRQLGFTGVYVTHDQAEALSLGSLVAVMNAGRIEQFGPPEQVYNSPATEYVAQFLGIRNSLVLSYDGGWRTDIGELKGDIGSLRSAAGKHRLYLRPEHVSLHRTPPADSTGLLVLGRGQIRDALYVGSVMEYVIGIGEAVLHSTISAGATVFSPGEELYIAADRDNALIYTDGKLTDPRMCSAISETEYGEATVTQDLGRS